MTVMAAAPCMSLAGKLRAEPGKLAVLDHLDVLADGTFHGSVHRDSFSLKFIQGSKADSPHDDAVNLLPAQCLEGLTHSVRVMQVSIFQFFHLHGVDVYDNEAGCRAEMSKNLAVDTFKTFCGNANFHDFDLQIISYLMMYPEVILTWNNEQALYRLSSELCQGRPFGLVPCGMGL